MGNASSLPIQIRWTGFEVRRGLPEICAQTRTDGALGFPTLIHYFRAGVGGGALAIGSLLFMLRKRRTSFFHVARYAAFVAPIVVLDDAVVLILELGRPSRFLNIFTHINFESPLWIGSWLMVIFLVVSTLFAFTFVVIARRNI